MDRRGFLKAGGAAAVAASSAGTAANSGQLETRPPPARTIRPGALTLSLAPESGYDLIGFGADWLARRIEVATGGRYMIERSLSATEADLTYGSAHRHAVLHPAFVFFAGLPLGQGLSAGDFETWMVAGGGQMLWDELAAQFGFKPLAAGCGGERAGLWSNVRLEAEDDFSGLPVHVSGLAVPVLRALGARPVDVPVEGLATALASGGLHAVEWLGPLPALSFDLRPVAQSWYEPGLHTAGEVVSLTVRRQVWDMLNPADQAIFEACASEERYRSLAEAKMHLLASTQLNASQKWPVRRKLPSSVRSALRQATSEVLEQVQAHDLASNRIANSYWAFELLGSGRPSV